MDPHLKARKNLLKWSKNRAKKKGITFNLDLEDIVIPDVCPVLGLPLALAHDRPSNCSPSLDRIDPAKGYTKGNVQVVSYRANRLKADASLLELCAVASYYSHFLASSYLHIDRSDNTNKPKEE